MRINSTNICACAVTLVVVLALALGEKNLARPVDSQHDIVRERMPNGGSKRYGSSPRNDVRRYGVASIDTQNGVHNGVHNGVTNGAAVHDGHRMITRALWRIFDALMQKKDHSQLYGRMGFVEEALKKMISVDSQLEDEIDKLKDEMVTCRAQLGTVMEELERMKNIDSRLEVLEQGRPDLAQQDDQEHGWAAAYSYCPQPFDKVEGECYHLKKDEKLGWEDARRDCERLGGDLASPRSLPALRDYLTGLPDRPEYLWVGGTQLDDGSWVWSSGPQAGVPIDMSKDTWNEEVPSGSGKCMGLFGQSSYRAYNYDCKEKDFFVCQYQF